MTSQSIHSATFYVVYFVILPVDWTEALSPGDRFLLTPFDARQQKKIYHVPNWIRNRDRSVTVAGINGQPRKSGKCDCSVACSLAAATVTGFYWSVSVGECGAVPVTAMPYLAKL